MEAKGGQMNVHFLSQSIHWATPQGVYQELDAEFDFNFDPCPLGGGLIDGLTVAWGSSTFCNPPYGKQIGQWTSKAVREYEKGKNVVLLIPSRTDTRWWHSDIMKASEIRFIKGRLKFGQAKNSAPFPSALAIYNG